MAQETFGAALQRIRKDARVSQWALANLLGLQGTAPISALETGKRQPQRETVDRLAKVLNLSVVDASYLRGLAGYETEPMTMPRAEVLLVELEQLARNIRLRKYPVYLTDYRLAFWLANPAVSELMPSTFPGYQGDPIAAMKWIARESITSLEFVFNSRLPFRDLFANSGDFAGYRERFEREQVYWYHGWNKYRRHLPFFHQCLEHMKERLPDEDYARFQRLWDEAWQNSSRDDFLPPANALAGPTDSIVMYLDGDDTPYAFDLLATRPLHVSDLFNGIYYDPSTSPNVPKDNLARCQDRFEKYENPPDDWQCVKLWELRDIATLLEELQGT